MVPARTNSIACMLLLYLQFGAASAAPDASLFAALPETADVQLSPSGRYLASKLYKDGQYMLVIYDLDNLGKVKPVLASPKDQEVNWLRWKSDDRLLVSLRAADWRYRTATIETRLYALNPDGSNLRFLVPPLVRDLGNTEDLVQVADRVVDFLPEDPDHILMQFNPQDPRLPRIYRVNVRTARRALVKNGIANVVDWTVDQQGRPRLAYALDDQKMQEQYLYRHPDSKEWDVLWTNPLDELADFSPVLFDRDDPDVAWVRSNHEGRTTGLYRYRFSTRTFIEKLFVHPEVDIDHVQLDPSSRRVVGVTYTVAESQQHWFDPELAELFAEVRSRIAPKHLCIEAASDGYRRVIFYGESPDLPGRYYIYERGSKTLQYFAYAYPKLEKLPMAPMRATSYEARDGLTIPAYVSLPAGVGATPETPLPAIVMPHGGPAVRNFSSFYPLVQLFTSRGYAVLQMNYRGSGGYGAEYRNAGYRQWGQAMQDDITDGTRWLAAAGIADPQRTCIVGWGYGGYAALMGVVKEPDLYACAVSIAGLSDLPEYLNWHRKYVNDRIFTRHIGDGWRDRKSLAENSPVNGAARIQVPVLLAHGTDDRNVPISQATAMAKALERAGKTYEYVELKDADITVQRNPERSKLFTAVDEFVKKSFSSVAPEGAPTRQQLPADPAP